LEIMQANEEKQEDGTEKQEAESKKQEDSLGEEGGEA
jgi:hypothetical protein